MAEAWPKEAEANFQVRVQFAKERACLVPVTLHVTVQKNGRFSARFSCVYPSHLSRAARKEMQVLSNHSGVGFQIPARAEEHVKLKRLLGVMLAGNHQFKYSIV